MQLLRIVGRHEGNYLCNLSSDTKKSLILTENEILKYQLVGYDIQDFARPEHFSGRKFNTHVVFFYELDANGNFVKLSHTDSYGTNILITEEEVNDNILLKIHLPRSVKNSLDDIRIKHVENLCFAIPSSKEISIGDASFMINNLHRVNESTGFFYLRDNYVDRKTCTLTILISDRSDSDIYLSSIAITLITDNFKLTGVEIKTRGNLDLSYKFIGGE